MNLGNILKNAVAKHPQATAIQVEDRCYSFLNVKAAVERFANQLRLGKCSGQDRIALLISNVPAFSVAYFSVLWDGRVVVPLNPLWSNHEIAKVLDDCQPSMVIVQEEYRSRWKDICQNQELAKAPELLAIVSDPVAELANAAHVDVFEKNELRGIEPQAESEDTAVILYTSGSTGSPKGVELTHRNLFLNAQSVSLEKFSSAGQRNVLGPGHVGLAVLPLSHAFGQTNLQNGIWFSGGAMVYQSRFDADETIERFSKQKITFFAGVPTMFYELVVAARKQVLPKLSLRFCVCGGASLSKQIKREFAKLFGVEIQESYGLTETSPMVSCQKIDCCEKAGCVGKPIDGVEVQIVDEDGHQVPNGLPGEIRVRGHNVFNGYHRNPAATTKVFSGEWFCTGDMGLLDEDGELRVVDRKKDMIKSGGYAVMPREIENVLHDLEWVDQAVVIGVPDEKYGEKIKAVVKLVDDLAAMRNRKNSQMVHDSVIADIKAACKKKLASYKCPKIVEVMDELPTGTTGKIDRNVLRKN